MPHPSHKMMRFPSSAPSFKHTAQTPNSSASFIFRGGERLTTAFRRAGADTALAGSTASRTGVSITTSLPTSPADGHVGAHLNTGSDPRKKENRF